MNWDDLRYLLAIARGGTLSAAAKALGVTHTTVSRRLAGCEQALGVRLFDRMPDGYHATPAGMELVELAERTEGEVLAAEGRVMGRDLALRGSLRVSTLDFLFSACRPAFVSFLERYPSVDVTVTAPMESVSLTRREADVALRVTDSPPPGLVGRRVGCMAISVFASPALAQRVGADADYSAYPWIGLDERLDTRWFDTWMADNAPAARIVARIDENSMLARQMVLGGVGVYFMPIVEGDALGMCRVGPVLPLQVEVWLLTLRELRHTSRVRAFLDHMGEALVPLISGPARADH